MSDFAVEREHRVSPIELFFDLVFVFAFTQVTTLWLEQSSWAGLGRGLLVLAVLWWVWAGYAWLTNAADADAGIVTWTLLFASGLGVAMFHPAAGKAARRAAGDSASAMSIFATGGNVGFFLAPVLATPALDAMGLGSTALFIPPVRATASTSARVMG